MTDVSEAGRLEQIAARLVEQSRRQGADIAEASASSGWELTAKVRLGQPELSEPDSFAGPADPSLLSKGPYAELDLFDESLDQLGADAALRRAEEAEGIALAQDSRLSLSEGATLSRVSG